MFSLVKFIEEGSAVCEDGPMTYPIEVISSSWISSDRSSCMFPPRNINFDNAVKKHFKPNEKWADCNIQIVCSKDNLQKVRRIRQEYLAGSSFEDSDDSEQESQNNNNNTSFTIETTAPSLKLPMPTTSFHSNYSSQEDELNLHFGAGNSNSQDKNKSQNVIIMKDTSGFEEMVLRKLEKISRQLKELGTDVRDLKNSTNITADSLDLVGIPGLPLSSVIEMEAMENYLKGIGSTTNLEIMLARTGGKSVKESTERILESLMNDELAELFSWAGRKKKKDIEKQKAAFKQTDLIKKHVIFKAVNRIHADSKDKDVENIIKDWLKYAASRRQRKN